VQGETVLLSLDMEGIAASAGSACTTGRSDPSHVLVALGYGEERCRASLRFTVGRGNTEDEIDDTVGALAQAVERVRQLSPIG
jgi:cysteine desulfurase